MPTPAFYEFTAMTVRNLVISDPAIPLPQLDIQLYLNDTCIYTSSRSGCATLNPDWFPLDQCRDFQMHVDRIIRTDDSAPLQFTAHVTSTTSASVRPHVLLTVPFQIHELQVIPLSLSDIYPLPVNTLLFQFEHGQIYSTPNVLKMLAQHNPIYIRNGFAKHEEEDICPVDLVSLQTNYTQLFQEQQKHDELLDIQSRYREIITNQLKKARSLPQEEGGSSSSNNKNVADLRAEVEKLTFIAKREAKALAKEKLALDETLDVQASLTRISGCCDELRSSLYPTLETDQQDIGKARHEALRQAHRIRTKQVLLIAELLHVYPIEYVGMGEYSIRGMKVYNSDLYQRDEEHVSTALGFICHLLFMLGKYLQVPLRYHVVHFSSRSFIKDMVQGIGGEYPLYRKGVDKERFERAIVLLNRNVQQILAARNVVMDDRIPILARLKALVDGEITWLEQHSSSSYRRASAALTTSGHDA